jgi:hypothetical protein
MTDMFRHFRYLLFVGLLFWLPGSVHARDFCFCDEPPRKGITDSTHSPKKAAILSALLPGAGQAYNKKYWKMPIVYAAGITGGYMIATNHREFKTYKEAYIHRTDTNPATIDLFPKYSASQLKVYRDYYRRNTELSVILTTVVYLIQILDATVDAHLFEFDVTNNLALQWRPFIMPTQNVSRAPTMGLSLTFSFRKPYMSI